MISLSPPPRRSIFPLRMRSVLACLMLCTVAVAARAAEAEFVRVWPEWRTAESFERIGEYFGRPENTGRDIILRTKSDVRAGYYFLVRVKSGGARPAARFELSVIRPDSPEPKVFTFPAALPERETVFQLGLTGPDWPAGRKGNPVAWKIALIDGNGAVLAEHKSFLWEKPAK
jgi:hypothetical protein